MSAGKETHNAWDTYLACQHALDWFYLLCPKSRWETHDAEGWSRNQAAGGRSFCTETLREFRRLCGLARDQARSTIAVI